MADERAMPLPPIEGFSISEMRAWSIRCEGCGLSHVTYGAHVDLGLLAWSSEHYERCSKARELALRRFQTGLEDPPEG